MSPVKQSFHRDYYPQNQSMHRGLMDSEERKNIRRRFSSNLRYWFQVMGAKSFSDFERRLGLSHGKHLSRYMYEDHLPNIYAIIQIVKAIRDEGYVECTIDRMMLGIYENNEKQGDNYA